MVFLQTDPIPGGSANAYDYASQDPINSADLTGLAKQKGRGRQKSSEYEHISDAELKALYDGTKNAAEKKKLLKELKARGLYGGKDRSGSRHTNRFSSSPPASITILGQMSHSPGWRTGGYIAGGVVVGGVALWALDAAGILLLF